VHEDEQFAFPHIEYRLDHFDTGRAPVFPQPLLIAEDCQVLLLLKVHLLVLKLFDLSLLELGLGLITYLQFDPGHVEFTRTATLSILGVERIDLLQYIQPFKIVQRLAIHTPPVVFNGRQRVGAQVGSVFIGVCS